MPKHYGTGLWQGLPHFQCWDCPFDTLEDEPAMIAHIDKTGHGKLSNYTPSIEDQVHAISAMRPKFSAIIALGYLCWNTRTASVEGVRSLLAERRHLVYLGAPTQLFVVDNGSSDGTYDAVVRCQPDADLVVAIGRNIGSCAARNILIARAIQIGAKYLLLMDGDIEAVPLSVQTMARYLDCHPDVGCIGACPSSWTVDREYTTPYLIEIPESRVKSDLHCAFTQYGLFRVEMFKQGITFDEAYGIGWGFEDDDLYCQMVEKGWRNLYFNGLTYLHRNMHSSWESLAKGGHNVGRLFDRRKNYFLVKWANRGMSLGTIRSVEAQSLPVQPHGR